MEPILTFEQWSTIDRAFWKCQTDIQHSNEWVSRLYSILVEYNLASPESTDIPELSRIAKHWISTHYLSNLPPKNDARRLWHHWVKQYGPCAERLMPNDEKWHACCSEHRPGYVYILKMGDWYKIGRSKHPLKRFPQLSVKMPLPTRLWMLFFSDDMIVLENIFHELYRDNRTNGEWFALTDTQVRNLYQQQPFLYAETDIRDSKGL